MSCMLLPFGDFVFAAFSRISCSVSRLLSARILKLPHLDCEAGMAVFFTQLPFANWKKSSQASAERSIREVSNPVDWAIVEKHIAYSIIAVAMLRRRVFCIEFCSLRRGRD